MALIEDRTTVSFTLIEFEGTKMNWFIFKTKDGHISPCEILGDFA
jgi:hypothetical protein